MCKQQRLTGRLHKQALLISVASSSKNHNKVFVLSQRIPDSEAHRHIVAAGEATPQKVRVVVWDLARARRLRLVSFDKSCLVPV